MWDITPRAPEPTMTAREQQMIDAVSDYHTHAAQAAASLGCASGTCDDSDCEHDGDEMQRANTHALLASAAAALFQGMAALEAATRMQA